MNKWIILALGLSTPLAMANERPVVMDRLVVAGSADDSREIGGSVHFLDPELLDRWSYTDVNRILRQAPGVYLQEEDGYGLRPNIGIRGSGNNRSSRVVIMEDGVLMAPAPYAAPAAYYFPYTGRMHSAEVVKGPAAIQYGPQTTGGAIQFRSTPIPGTPGSGLGGQVDVLGGNYDARRAHGVVGGYLAPVGDYDVGFMLEGIQDSTTGFKELDGGGDTGYRIRDYVAKLVFESRPEAAIDQSLELKVQSFDETSNETYLGLTLDDFRDDPYRRYRGSQRDVMNVEHRTLQATHFIDLGNAFDLTTTAYRNDTERAWYKLNDVGGVGISTVLADPEANVAEFAALSGLNSADGVLNVRNNNREYYSQGIQTVLGKAFSTGAADHQLEVSLRFHQDEEDRLQEEDAYTMVNGTMVLDQAGARGSQANRVSEAEAWSFYLRDVIDWGDWSFAPGVRYENITLTRTDYANNDPDRSEGPDGVDESDVDIWIPGASVTWQQTPSLQWLAGAHRGFTNPGPGSDADNETSWNYEAGLRWFRGLLALETIAFYSDYSNLVGTCTASTGAGCDIGDQFDGGEAEVSGLEFMAHYDAGLRLGMDRLGVPLSAIYTYTRAEFGNTFDSGFGPWGEVTAGDEMPYVPAHQLTLNAGLNAAHWRTTLSLNYVDEARAVAGSGTIPADQEIDSRVLLDLVAEVDVTQQTALFASVDNLTDEVYNVSFSPAGARPGKPRTWMAGIKTTF